MNKKQNTLLVDRLPGRKDVPASLAGAFEKVRISNLPGRLKLITRRGGVSWYNDVAAGDLNAVFYSMHNLPGKIIWVVCNDEAHIPIDEINELLMEKVRAIIVLGKSALKIEDIYGSRISVLEVRSLLEAYKLARRMARKDETVLFSPGTKNICGARSLRMLEKNGEIML